MPEQICLNLADKEQLYQLALVALILSDYFLGATDKVKAASLLELVFPPLRRARETIELSKRATQQPVQGEKNGTDGKTV